MGYRFLRQRPVLNYIADFMCKPLMLIIEVDGFSHNHELVGINDVKRRKNLERIGFTVMCFQDEEVMQNLDSVKMAIARWIEAFENDHR